MKIRCENCGEVIVVSGLGRKRFNTPVKIVCDTLREHSTVGAAADKLGCSRAYIHKILKDNNLTAKKVRGF